MSANAGFVRVVIVAQAAVIVIQAVTAGLVLTAGSGHALHSAGGDALFGLTLVHLALAVMAWRPGGGSPRQILYAAAFVVVVVAQVYIGIAHVMVVHLPLGLLLFGA